MSILMSNSPSGHLPITRDLTPVFILSLVTAFLMTAVSLGGLLFPSTIYPTTELRETFLTNDLVNLLVGLPVLLVSIWLTKHGKLICLLCWPGALLYIAYNYLAYLFGIPAGGLTLIFLLIVLISVYTTVLFLRNIDAKNVQEHLAGAVPVRLSGWVLLLFGVMFSLRAMGILFQDKTSQISSSELGVLVADLAISMLWIVGGISLLRHKPFGYVSGLGLLFTGSALFIALIMFLLLQPILTGAPFVLMDIIVVAVMGLVCFIPTGLFIRGVTARA